MAFYENTIVARQDLAEKELLNIKNKYKDLINGSSGNTIKIEEWGLLIWLEKLKILTKVFLYITSLRGIKIL